MYTSNNYLSNNISLIDPARPENIVIYLEDGEETEFDDWILRHKVYGYLNNGIRVTFLYNEDFTNSTILEHKRATKEELKHIKDKYKECIKRQGGHYIGDDDSRTRYNFDD